VSGTPIVKIIDKLTAHARRLKGEISALYLAARDPRVPWYAKALLVFVVAYALSPIDLIPDVIPIVGYVDDLLLLPLAIYLALKMVPETVLAECRQKTTAKNHRLPKSWLAGTAIVLLWMIALLAFGLYLFRRVG
jgi:uncharacterized membrane protein YkvA (DUF1232 family)